jgi:hypothetical protein
MPEPNKFRNHRLPFRSPNRWRWRNLCSSALTTASQSDKAMRNEFATLKGGNEMDGGRKRFIPDAGRGAKEVSKRHKHPPCSHPKSPSA